MAFVYDKTNGQRHGGNHTITEGDDKLVFEFCKPSTKAILSITAERSALEAKIAVFAKRLNAATWEKDDRPIRLDIGYNDLLPIAQFVVEHLTGIKGLSDPAGNTLTIDDLEHDHLIDLCLHLEAQDLLLLAGAVRDSAGLREDLEGKSSPSSGSTETDANAPDAPA